MTAGALAQQLAAAGPWPDVPAVLADATSALPPAATGGSRPALHATPAAGGAGCASAHTVARSPRGDGLVALALLLPLDPARPAQAALAAALGLAAQQHLQRVPWLAKDVVLAFVDARCGAVAAAQVGKG